jgi:hypothetical protein
MRINWCYITRHFPKFEFCHVTEQKNRTDLFISYQGIWQYSVGIYYILIQYDKNTFHFSSLWIVWPLGSINHKKITWKLQTRFDTVWWKSATSNMPPSTGFFTFQSLQWSLNSELILLFWNTMFSWIQNLGKISILHYL